MRKLLFVTGATIALLIVSVLTRAQAPAGQGGPPGSPGRGGPPPIPLSQVKWETWNNPGLRTLPTNVEPEPLTKADVMAAAATSN
jgi:hypothetical protein